MHKVLSHGQLWQVQQGQGIEHPRYVQLLALCMNLQAARVASSLNAPTMAFVNIRDCAEETLPQRTVNVSTDEELHSRCV